MSSDSSLESGESLNLPPRRRRDNLPQTAREYLRHWLRDHISYPYPTEDEKALFARVLQLTPLQVNNWFINARRRELPKIKVEMGILTPDSLNHTPRKFLKRQRSSNTDADSDNDELPESPENSHMSGPQPKVSLLNKLNTHSSLAKTFDDVNITVIESEYNLKLLSFAALIHDSHCHNRLQFF